MLVQEHGGAGADQASAFEALLEERAGRPLVHRHQPLTPAWRQARRGGRAAQLDAVEDHVSDASDDEGGALFSRRSTAHSPVPCSRLGSPPRSPLLPCRQRPTPEDRLFAHARRRAFAASLGIAADGETSMQLSASAERSDRVGGGPHRDHGGLCGSLDDGSCEDSGLTGGDRGSWRRDGRCQGPRWPALSEGSRLQPTHTACGVDADAVGAMTGALRTSAPASTVLTRFAAGGNHAHPLPSASTQHSSSAVRSQHIHDCRSIANRPPLCT